MAGPYRPKPSGFKKPVKPDPRFAQKRDENEALINAQITAPQVRLVGDNIPEPGIYPRAKAMALADELELDLVLISDKADPPVCKILDYQKFLYQQRKKAKEMKSNSAKVVMKEIRFGPNTDEHDFQFKLKHAREFLQEGASVCLMGRSEERGREAAARLAQEAGAERICFLQGDVKSVEDCGRVVKGTVAHFGRLDVLVNSAGIYREGALEDLGEEELDDILACNVKGVFHMTKAALPALKAARGAVVNVSSDAGVHGNYFCTAYCASKGAVVLFTRALALEVAAFGVRVNAIAPGDIMTPLTEAQLGTGERREANLREMAAVYPLGRIGTAQEAASLIVFLASARASFVTGAIYGIDGGLTA